VFQDPEYQFPASPVRAELIDQDTVMITLPRGNNKPFIVLIDGRSGAGKTTLANALVASMPTSSVLHLENFYPGWDGLEAASQSVVRDVLEPLRAGRMARLRRWDWVADAPAEWVIVRPTQTLIVEGVGSLSRSAKRLVDFALWIELDATERKRRAVKRDGEMYEPHWNRWAAQEERFAARKKSRLLADRIIDGRTLDRHVATSAGG
jgi:uridine kinase